MTRLNPKDAADGAEARTRRSNDGSSVRESLLQEQKESRIESPNAKLRTLRMLRPVAWIRTAVHATAALATARIYALPDPAQAAGDGGGAGLPRIIGLGALATLFLYLAMLPGPLYEVVPSLPGRALFTQARRALGVSAAVLGALHGYHSIVDWIGGLDALKYWGTDYIVSLVLGALASAVLLVLAATSFDAVVLRMGPAWRTLHRSIYVAGLLVVAHAMMVTIHILNLTPLLWLGFALLLLLLSLEMLRLRKGGWSAAPLAVSFTALTAVFYWSFFLIGHHRH